MAEPSMLNREEIIPTLVSYSPVRREMVIGNEARTLGIAGHTNAHDFKMQIGDAHEFDRKAAFWVHVPEPGKPPAQTFSCREITTIFLREVLSRCLGRYEKVMIGYPALQDTWAETYRANIREIIQSLGFADPLFLPEPFAVFQYYRHVEKLIPEERRSQLILLIDIGGGTCNTCIVKTTGEGLIALGGVGSKPYGTTAVSYGGKSIDLDFLKIALDTRRDLAKLFKDNPIERARNVLSALLKIEDAKLSVCRQLTLLKNPSLKGAAVVFDRGELTPDTDLTLEFNSSHLQTVVKNAWTTHWLKAVTTTIRESEKQLKLPINELDKVILCGGCGQLPFLREFVAQSLSKWVRSPDDIIVGKNPGFAVARGIQKECEIRAGKEPSLLANDLGRWALSSMYLGFRRNRVENYIPVRTSNPVDPYVLVPEWTRLDRESLEREIELPFSPGDRLFFGLFDRPIGSAEDLVPLNLQQDTLSVPRGTYRNRAKFIISQTTEGGLRCEIILFRRDRNDSQERLRLPEFFPESLRIHTGKSILGLDFGTSNTYLVELNLSQETRQTDYFSFRIKPRVKDMLTDLQARMAREQGLGLLDLEILKNDAFARRIDFVCHSVKLEGEQLTRGETVEVVEKAKPPLSQGQREAKCLSEAYQWMLETYEELLRQPEGFARELNKRLLKDLHPEAGQYRSGAVKVLTREGEYLPPDGPLVPVHMRDWGAYVRNESAQRSPVEFAAALHSIFVRIHPFADGNGRTARLLVNAHLLNHGLPVVVPTIDDRERYIDGLTDSDAGNGDEFTMYLIELVRQSLDGLQYVGVDTAEMFEPQVNVSIEDDDPLARVMGGLIERDRLPAKKIYEPWRVTFEGLKGEMDILVNQFNETYSSDGYSAKIIPYDILSEEKFSRLFLGLPMTKTWFFGLELSSRRTNERFMFFFEHYVVSSKNTDEGCVALHLSRFDGDEYRPLSSDVFQPCEIAWQDGSIQFNWSEDVFRNKPLRYQVRALFAELIKAFLDQPRSRPAA